MKMEAVSSSETLASTYESTQRHKPDQRRCDCFYLDVARVVKYYATHSVAIFL
jgi:hypothetical protein